MLDGPASVTWSNFGPRSSARLHRGCLLFVVQLDADEAPPQRLTHFWVFKRLVGHHMAPVAGGVANAHKDRFVFWSPGPGPSRSCEGTGLSAWSLEIGEEAGCQAILHLRKVPGGQAPSARRPKRS